MNKHFSLSAAVFLCIQLNTAFSQESLSPMISVLPPSPEVASMNKFTDVPVSYYIGLPQITIPVHTIQMKKIQVPISIDYHASGLRVSEYSSWVGAGWSLSGTGVISRTIRGKTDERFESPDFQGYFYASNWLNSDGTVNYSVLTDCSSGRELTMDPLHPYYTPVNPPDYLAAGVWDTEPDQYNYSYPGGGGKFIFNHQADLILLTPQDVCITHPFTAVSPTMHQFDYYWEIVGPDGTKYIYGWKAEKTSSTNPCTSTASDGIPLPDESITSDQTSWFLTRIENGSEYVNYGYVPIIVKDSVRSSESAKIKIAQAGESSYTECRSTRTRNTYRLSSISSSDGYSVSFIAGGLRNDLEGSYNLDKIEVRFLGNVVKVVDLNNDVYYGTNTKLKLESVEIQDGNSNVLNKYSLEYYAGSFPDHDTPQQDYWGYYNGATVNSTSLLPEWWNDDYHVNINTATSREPSLEHTKIGTLRKVTYPTGGSATFDYELNDYSGPNTEVQRSYYVQADGELHNTDKDSVRFTVNQDCSVTMIYGGIPDGMDAFAGLRKKNPSTGVYEGYTPDDRPGVNPAYMIAIRKDLEAGDYELWAESWGENIELEIKFEEKGLADYQVAGGLRIKKISNHDPETNLTTHTLFEYTRPNEDKSSGRLMTNPISEGYYSEYMHGEIVGLECLDVTSAFSREHYLNLASYVQLSLGTVSGAHVGYSTVKVHKVSDADLTGYLGKPNTGYSPEYALFPDSLDRIGQDVFTYINDYPRTDTVGYNRAYPYVPFPHLDYKNGQLLSQETYENVNGTLELQKVLLNFYDTLKTDTLRSFIFRRTFSTYCYHCSEGQYINDNTYIDYGRRTRLKKSIERSFETGNTRELVTHYEYDYPNHLDVAANFTIQSNNDTARVEFSRNDTYPALVHRLDRFVNGTLLDSDSLEYVDNLPNKYYKWDRNSGYDLRTEIFRNDDELVEYVENKPPSGGAPIVSTYLFSYGDAKRPVAQIQNMDTAQVDVKLAQINATYNRDWLRVQTDETLIENTLEALRVSMEAENAMTYYLYESSSMAFGPVKIVDPNGFARSFEYDTFGRLQHVYDQDQNLVRKITYNLKNN